MDLNPLLDWVAETALSRWVTGSPWVWPGLETLHFFGLSVLIGGLVIMDLRVMGYKCGLPLGVVHQIMPLVFVGFAINACSGFLFVMGDPHRYAANYAFKVKMMLLLLAGLNALWFALKVSPQMKNWTESTEEPPRVKFVGAVSLILWFSVGIHGRLITFFG